MMGEVWEGLYGERWGEDIVPEAYAHPAKFSRGLIRRIYEHVVEEGWLQAGDVVMDPFGGVALGALDAMRRGLCWVGVELEPKFVELGRANLALWVERYGARWEGWGQGVLLEGDSRQLGEVLRVDGVVTSPPFGRAERRDRWGVQGGAVEEVMGRQYTEARQGEREGNLAGMVEDGFDGVVSSPPWGKGAEGGVRKEKFRDWESFAAAMAAKDGKERRHGTSVKSRMAQLERESERVYGESEGQLGQIEVGETFWEAARDVVAGCWRLVRPGGIGVWVVKGFVRKKRYVDFPGQWLQLCEAMGWERLHVHKAMLVEERGRQFDLWGNGHDLRVERKSFFRRLAEKKGSPRVDFEVVLCMRRR